MQIVEEILSTSSAMESNIDDPISANDPRSSSPVEDVSSPLLLVSTSADVIPMETQSGTDDKG